MRFQLFCQNCQAYIGSAQHVCTDCGTRRPNPEHMENWSRPLPVNSHVKRIQLQQDQLVLVAPKSGELLQLNAQAPGTTATLATAPAPLRRYLTLGQSHAYIPGQTQHAYAWPRTANAPVSFETEHQINQIVDSPDTLYLLCNSGYYRVPKDNLAAQPIWQPVTKLTRLVPLDNRLLLITTRQATLATLYGDAIGEPVTFKPQTRLDIPPLWVNGRIVLAMDRNKLVVLELVNQRLESTVHKLPFKPETITSNKRDTVFIAGKHNAIYCLNLTSNALTQQATPNHVTWIRELVYWNGLLIYRSKQTQTPDSKHAIVCQSVASDSVHWLWSPPANISAGPVVTAEGTIFCTTADARLHVLPWHQQKWEWAAEFLAGCGESTSARHAYILASKFSPAYARCKAEKDFVLAARLAKALGYSNQAALAYVLAAEDIETNNRMLAGIYHDQASHHFGEDGQKTKQAQHAKRAGKQAGLPAFLIEPLNAPYVEHGDAAAFQFQLHNVGRGKAERVEVSLTGDIQTAVMNTLAAFPSEHAEVLVFDNIVPAKQGTSQLTLLLNYYCGGKPTRTSIHVDYTISAPPPGQIRVDGDVGILKVDGATPSVRIKGDMGLVKFVNGDND